jgi:hypothetical protein
MSSDQRAVAQHAADIRDAAQRLHHGTGEPGSSMAAPGALVSLEEALQVLSAGWFELAADAAPWVIRRRRQSGTSKAAGPRSDDALSRAQEVHLAATFHDLAAAFAGCARACRETRATAVPLIERRDAGELRTTVTAGFGGPQRDSTRDVRRTCPGGRVKRNRIARTTSHGSRRRPESWIIRRAAPHEERRPCWRPQIGVGSARCGPSSPVPRPRA